jgi:hypothetical protein
MNDKHIETNEKTTIASETIAPETTKDQDLVVKVNPKRGIRSGVRAGLRAERIVVVVG